MFAPNLLAGKKILVTGGGTGLGRSIGQHYLSHGASLVICGRRQEVLDQAVAELTADTGGSVTAHRCDIRDAAQVEAMFDAIWATGPLDGLLNNAAANFISPAEKLSPRAFDAVVNITLHGTAFCTLAAGRRWIADERPGTILSILSTSVFTGRAFTMASAAAKAGVLAMTRSLAVEWGPKGIRLLGIAPGLIPTPGAWNRLRPHGTQENSAARSVPLRRMGEHAEIANLMAFLMSDMAPYMNGDVITIDGGRWLQEGGDANKALFDWTDAEWDEFRTGLRRKGL